MLDQNAFRSGREITCCASLIDVSGSGAFHQTLRHMLYQLQYFLYLDGFYSFST